ncbi:hypothetical protein [Bradyrhizobium glycinis]|uniref:hypothetical protein n=1 Tax=Bradyrhizobium glycinis TaxID=2751812 RepID=UPI0018D66FA5|nr:hypothetical protein [Bradyrhizobium glycinis]MBH5373391.1 hypothetical protein [Bradyrhizobium glycinis]
MPRSSIRGLLPSHVLPGQSLAFQCVGWAIASGLVGAGLAIAFWGYSTTISPVLAAQVAATAIGDAFKRAEIKTLVSGTMSLSPDSELTISKDQFVRVLEGMTVKLDSSSTVRVVGDLKVNVQQPSKEQLQLETTSVSEELPFTRYTIFNSSSFGSGTVVTGWSFEVSDPTRLTYQRCYFEQVLDKGIAATQTIAIDGAAKRVSPLSKLPFDFEGALANCVWFPGT